MLELSDAARDLLAERGFDPVYGARPLKRAIQRMVLDPLAMEVLSGRIKDDQLVAVDVSGDALTFEARPRAEVATDNQA